MKKILLVEPFYRASHKQWCDGFKRHSQHHVDILSLPGAHWKWRMHGGAITLAKKYRSLKITYDVVICSDMLDVAVFKALSQIPYSTKFMVYFHESQFTYPWSKADKDPQQGRDNHYKFINYTSALAADQCLFNSNFHKKSFLEALPTFLRQFPDYKNLSTIEEIREKSNTLYLGVDLDIFKDTSLKSSNIPILLWNHRWEYDKNPTLFFKSCLQLQQEKIPFGLIILGERMPNSPSIMEEAIQMLKSRIIHTGYAKDRSEYARLVQMSSILPVTSRQDFFGASVVEATFAGVTPLCPNRLAYPEYLPQETLYASDEEFVQKLRNLCLTSVQDLPSYSSSVGQFNWKHIIKSYDEYFS